MLRSVPQMSQTPEHFKRVAGPRWHWKFSSAPNESMLWSAQPLQVFSLPDCMNQTSTSWVSTYNFWCRLQLARSGFTYRSIEEIDGNMSCFIKVYEVIQHEAIAWRLLHCDMVIGCTVSFALGMTALQRFLTTWEENYMAGKKSSFPLYLMQLFFFFPVRDLRGNFDIHLSLVLFIPLILIKHCWSTLSEKKALSRHWSS